MQTHTETKLTEDGKLARAEYIKQWKKNHPDRVKAHNANYWNRKAEQIKECEKGETITNE